MSTWRAVRCEIVREMQETFFYKANLLGDFVAQVLLFGALIFLGGFHQVGMTYGAGRVETRSLVLLGYLFWSYSSWAIGEMGSNVANEAAKGTLEHRFTSVAPPAALLLGKALGGVVLSTGFVALVVGVITLLFGVAVPLSAGALLALLLTLVGMYGIGLIFAGAALVAKRIAQLVLAMQIILLFISGTLAPPAIFPQGLRWLSEAVPLTEGIDLARLSVTKGHIAASAWLLLALTSTAYLLLGLIAFQLFARRAKVDGLLGRY